ncbi:MAG: DUF4198 domain-containing protein [Phycisphaerales bacterium]|nr:DUF4198 domain-containing protein [Phycisphaerales bacterium]
MPLTIRTPLVILPLLLTGAPALAQHLVVLPSAFDAPLGADVTLRSENAGGNAPSPAPWPVEIAWLFVRSGGTQENRGPQDAPKPFEGQVKVTPASPGVALIGLDLPARTESAQPARVLSAAHAAGRTDVCPDRPILVRWVKSAATLVRVRDESGRVPPDGTGTSKAGLLAEIRPLMDAALTPAGGVLPVRAYLLGDAAPGAVILATHSSSGETQRVTSDAKGIADIQITLPGTWVIRSTMLRAAAEGEAAMSVGEASLTFDAPPPPPVPAP